MAKYLISTTEVYRCDNENEVNDIITRATETSLIKPPKVSHEYKEKKQKGEVVEAWYKVSVTNYFNDEKEPAYTTEVSYDKGSAF